MDIKFVKKHLGITNADIATMFGYKDAASFANATRRGNIEAGIVRVFELCDNKAIDTQKHSFGRVELPQESPEIKFRSDVVVRRKGKNPKELSAGHKAVAVRTSKIKSDKPISRVSIIDSLIEDLEKLK